MPPDASSASTAGASTSVTCARPARPIPTIFPITSCGAVAAEISSSMTRPVFSATTPDATHSP
jgi:hypothetical protein